MNNSDKIWALDWMVLDLMMRSCYFSSCYKVVVINLVKLFVKLKVYFEI